MNDENSPDEVTKLISKLTQFERKCLELVSKGLASKEIAREVNLSPNTVDAYLRSATSKLGVRSRFMAAQMVLAAENNAENIPPSKLIYENSSIPPDAQIANDKPSAGEGDGPGDLEQDAVHRPVSHDSGKAPTWLEPTHPIAKFFGGENRLSLAQRVLWMLVLAIGIGIGFGGLVSGLLQLSRLFSSP